MKNSLLALALLVPFAAADNLQVGPPGSGAPYTSIHAAVADAQAGDSVIVDAGVYPSIDPLVIDKPLTILGRGSKLSGTSDTVLVQHPDLLGVIQQPLRITGLAAGEEVRIIGIDIAVATYGVYPYPYPMLGVVDCDGAVVLADLSTALARIETCAQVILDDCALYGRGFQHDGTIDVPALAIIDSSVVMTSCDVLGGSGESGPPPSGATYADGGLGLHVEGSELDASASRISGGAGRSPMDDWWFTPGGGGPGIHATDSRVRLLGGAGCELKGGPGGWSAPSPFGGGYIYGATGSAGTVEADATLTSTPDVAFGTTPVVHGAWSQLTERVAVATGDLEIAYQGNTLVVDLEGEPGSTLFLALGFDLGPALEVPGTIGQVQLDLVAHVVLATVVLDVQGESSYAGLVPPWPTMPSLIGDSFVLQAVGISPGFTLSFSTPSIVGVQP